MIRLKSLLFEQAGYNWNSCKAWRSSGGLSYWNGEDGRPKITTKDKFICLVWKKETNNFTKQSEVDTAETDLENQLYDELDNFFYESLKQKQFGSSSPEVANKTIAYIREQGYFRGGENTTTDYQTKTYFNPSKDKDGTTKEYVTISCGIRSTKQDPTTGNPIDWETYKESIQTFITTVQNKIQRSEYEDNEEE